MLRMHVNEAGKNLRNQFSDGSILEDDFGNAVCIPVHEYCLDQLQRVEGDWDKVYAKIVNVYVEAVALGGAEAVGS